MNFYRVKIKIWDFEARGQFNNTFTVAVYKSSYCIQSLKQWPHLWSTLAKVLLNWPQITSFRFLKKSEVVVDGLDENKFRDKGDEDSAQSGPDEEVNNLLMQYPCR